MSAIDDLLARARAGDGTAMGDWMGLVEGPIRSSLRRFARAIDVEAAVQETLSRMAIILLEGARDFEGENGSLRFALGVARNVALEELRHRHIPIPENCDPPVLDDPPRDPDLLRHILSCLRRLGRRAGRAIMARLCKGHEHPDRELAKRMGMELNTFYQSIRRARQTVEKCLAKKGVDVKELRS